MSTSLFSEVIRKFIPEMTMEICRIVLGTSSDVDHPGFSILFVLVIEADLLTDEGS